LEVKNFLIGRVKISTRVVGSDLLAQELKVTWCSATVIDVFQDYQFLLHKMLFKICHAARGLILIVIDNQSPRTVEYILQVFLRLDSWQGIILFSLFFTLARVVS
jgi:hypothetical protein